MRISDWSSDVCSSDLFPCSDGRPGTPPGPVALKSPPSPLVRCPLQESKTMSKNKMLSRALFAALVGAATFGAQAAEEPGFYLGAGAGQSFVDETGYDDEDTAFSAFGGYQFNQWFGLEAGYADLGELEPGVAGQSLEASSARPELQSLMRISYAVFCC